MTGCTSVNHMRGMHYKIGVILSPHHKVKYGVCNFVVISAVEVCVDYGGFYMFQVL